MLSNRPARRWFVSGCDVEASPVPAIDFQMHTVWTDGYHSVAEMIQSATERRLDAIAITEHVNETSHWYSEFVAEVKKERERQHAMKVYYGAEIAAADFQGRMKADPSRLDAEIILGVVHRYPKQSGNGFWKFDELTLDDAVELELRALAGLATNRQIDVLAHPGGTTYRKFGPFPVEWLEDVFRHARNHDVAVELNSKYLWDLPGMIRLLERVNPRVSFGSDAHRTEDVGSNHSSLLAFLTHTPSRP